jgi:hypothetical protein
MAVRYGSTARSGKSSLTRRGADESLGFRDFRHTIRRPLETAREFGSTFAFPPADLYIIRSRSNRNRMISISRNIDDAEPSMFSAGTCLAVPSSPLALKAPRFPLASAVPFCSFNRKYAGGTCYVLGRGPTDFNYNDLAHVTDPIFFINDAVCLEKLAKSETFFFAHDIQLRAWLDGSIHSTAVLPIDGNILGEDPGVVLNHAGPVVYYRRGERNRETLLTMSRDEIAEREELFVHTGAIHSLVHFIWFCGFRRAVFIGCDGLNSKSVFARPGAERDGYDRRLENKSQSVSGWNYRTIRRAQDLVLKLFGIEAIYRGTPVR